MKIEEFEAFAEGIAGVMSFYARDLSRFAMDVWWNALRPFDLKAITDAFNRHLTNPDAGQFPPKPADIVRMVDSATDELHVLDQNSFYLYLDGKGIPRDVVDLKNGKVLNPQTGAYEVGGVWSREREILAALVVKK